MITVGINSEGNTEIQSCTLCKNCLVSLFSENTCDNLCLVGCSNRKTEF